MPFRHGESRKKSANEEQEIRRMLITLDGASGVGKSSLGRALAARLTWPFVDTGEMYRAIAIACAGYLDEKDIAAELLQLKIGATSTGITFHHRGRLIEASDLYSQETERTAARVATITNVRNWVRSETLRYLNSFSSAVLTGRRCYAILGQNRDLFGLAVLLTADLNLRAQRRASATGLDFETQRALLAFRDEQVPTISAHDLVGINHVIIDTGCHAIVECIELILNCAGIQQGLSDQD